MIIPNAESAEVDIRKLRDYCLNYNHDEDKHKARLFESLLGMTASDAEELRNILQGKRKKNCACGMEPRKLLNAVPSSQ